MNSRNLIISFVTVSVAALIVSAFAVFTVARRYAADLSAAGAEESVSPPEVTEAPEESLSPPETTEASETEEESSEPPSTEVITASVTEEITETDAVTSIPESFILTLSGDRLVITDPSGETVYERIINASSLNEKDMKALLSGIEFPDKESAMSAVYDLIS